MMARDDDNDIVLGTGKLLALFFVVVITWAAFFGIGFMFGKSAQPSAAGVAASSASVSHEPKPSAGIDPGTASRTARIENEPTPSTEMATETTAPAVINPAPSKAVKPAPTPVTTTAAPPPAAAQQGAPPPEIPEAPPASPGRPTVQVAAFSSREDADALMEALHRKQYPVFILHNPSTDPLYHVQVGPFVDEQDAEATLIQLREKEGYKAILKR